MKGVKYLQSNLSISNTTHQVNTNTETILSFGVQQGFTIEGALKTNNKHSNSNSNSGSLEKSVNNKSNPQDNSSKEQVSTSLIYF